MGGGLLEEEEEEEEAAALGLAPMGTGHFTGHAAPTMASLAAVKSRRSSHMAASPPPGLDHRASKRSPLLKALSHTGLLSAGDAGAGAAAAAAAAPVVVVVVVVVGGEGGVGGAPRRTPPCSLQGRGT